MELYTCCPIEPIKRTTVDYIFCGFFIIFTATSTKERDSFMKSSWYSFNFYSSNSPVLTHSFENHTLSGISPPKSSAAALNIEIISAPV